MATAKQTETDFDSEFAEELEQLEYYSHGDYVEVEIISVERKTGDKAVVTFSPPLGDAFMKEMSISIDPSTDTEFTKLLREAGRNFTTASEIVGDRVPAKYTEDDWEIQYSEPERSFKERATACYEEGLTEEKLMDLAGVAAVIGAVFYWPISGLAVSLYAWLSEPEDEDDEELGFDLFAAAIMYGMGLLLWSLGFSIVTGIGHLIGIQFPVEVTLLL